MSRNHAELSKILHAGNNSATEVMSPNSVDHHARREGVVVSHEPCYFISTMRRVSLKRPAWIRYRYTPLGSPEASNVTW